MNRLETTCVQLLLLCVDLYCMGAILLFYSRFKQAVDRDKRNATRNAAKSKRFVYCDGPHKNKVVYVELVDMQTFANYDMFVDYPVLDMNNSSIYFVVPNANTRISSCTDRDNHYNR